MFIEKQNRYIVYHILLGVEETDFTSFQYVIRLLTNKNGCVVYRYFWGWRGKQRTERQDKIITVGIIYQFLFGVKEGRQGIQ